MPHTIYTFTLHRRGVVLAVVCAVLVAGLLFGAGWLLGAHRPALQPDAGAPAGTAATAPAATPASAAPAPGATAPAATPGPTAVATAPAFAGPSSAAPASAAEGSAVLSPAAPGEAAPKNGSALLPAVTFALEVGVFVAEEDSKRLVAELQQRGFEPMMVEEKGPLGHPLFRVMVGTYASRTDASQAAEAFTREEDRRAVVVEARLPKPAPGPS